MTNKLFVGILFGGRSVEHEISIKSAINVASNIDRNKFETKLIGISKSGAWFECDEVSENITNGDPLCLKLDSEKHFFYNENKAESLEIDIVFPVLHGTDGEDGSIQGMLTSAKIPFIGSGVLGSVNSMDKFLSKRLLKEANVPVGKFMLGKFDDKDSLTYQAVVENVGSPFIIKPAALGSSVGVSKVSSEEEFAPALNDSFNYDNAIIFEEFITGRELECAILGNHRPMASNPGEIVISKEYEFYTYEAKYQDEDAVKIVIPAEAASETIDKIKKYSIQAYEALNCEDFSRVDIFVADDGRVLVNEINTIPGFTNSSMFPSLWQDSGISFESLITKLVQIALEKTKRRNRLKTDYSEYS